MDRALVQQAFVFPDSWKNQSEFAKTRNSRFESWQGRWNMFYVSASHPSPVSATRNAHRRFVWLGAELEQMVNLAGKAWVIFQFKNAVVQLRHARGAVKAFWKSIQPLQRVP